MLKAGIKTAIYASNGYGPTSTSTMSSAGDASNPAPSAVLDLLFPSTSAYSSQQTTYMDPKRIHVELGFTRNLQNIGTSYQILAGPPYAVNFLRSSTGLVLLWAHRFCRVIMKSVVIGWMLHVPDAST
jgi:hypothetical protein